MARNSLLATMAVMLLAGCPGPTFVVQQYAGPPRPRETIAILRANGNDDVRLLFLDDEDIAAPIVEDGRLHIELLPARHSVVVARASTHERYPSIGFAAEADHVYRVAITGETPRVYEVDRSTDKVGRDVTIERSPAPAPTAVPPPASPPRDLDAGTPAE